MEYFDDVALATRLKGITTPRVGILASADRDDRAGRLDHADGRPEKYNQTFRKAAEKHNLTFTGQGSRQSRRYPPTGTFPVSGRANSP